MKITKQSRGVEVGASAGEARELASELEGLRNSGQFSGRPRLWDLFKLLQGVSA